MGETKKTKSALNAAPDTAPVTANAPTPAAEPDISAQPAAPARPAKNAKPKPAAKPKSKIGDIIKRDKRSLKNTCIIIAKVVASCILFFCCCVFFFQNMGMFWRDFTSYLFFFPVLFFAGIILICLYMSVLMGSIEDNTIINSDRYDLAYKIVFTVTFVILVVRSFLGDFNNTDAENATSLNVPIVIIVLAILSGLMTWLTPKIKDNDTTDF